jgi:hypothetical protein
MTIIKQIDVTITASPKELAEAFCDLGSNEQAEFFAHCHTIHERWTKQWEEGGRKTFYCSGMQWYHIGATARDLGMYSPAAEVIMDIAAPLYVHTLGFRFGQS